MPFLCRQHSWFCCYAAAVPFFVLCSSVSTFSSCGSVCLQPWDLALVLEFPGDASHPEDFGKIGHITRFVMEVRAV